MSNLAIGFDIGGTKIAAAAYDEAGREVAKTTLPTPQDYNSFLSSCRAAYDEVCIVADATVGAGMPVGVANMPFLVGHDLAADLSACLGTKVITNNDANCAALAEAIDGAGQGSDSVYALTLGTGVGGGFVYKGAIIGGANGLTGEIGHLPLPYYEPNDGELVLCNCGQTCLEKLVNGAGLSRLQRRMTGQEADAAQIAARASRNEPDALRVLDRYYTVVAKAMVTVLHSFDPDVIVVGGSLNALPGLYDEVPKRWGTYALLKTIRTRFVPAKHGAMAGLRGAAWLGRQAATTSKV